MEKPTTPTLDKVSELRPQMQAIGEFLEWLTGQGYVLGGHQYHRANCNVHDFGDSPEKSECICDQIAAECFGMLEDCPWPHADWSWRHPIRDRSESIERLLARYFEIDQQAMYREQGQLLAWIRSDGA